MIKWVVGVLLFLFLFIRTALLSLGKPFWLDETNGLAHTIGTGLRDLLIRAEAQNSPNPLAYIVDNFWARIWGNQPQLYWDLTLFFRIPPTFFWALAATSVYFYVFYFLKRVRADLRTWQALVIAVGSSIFFYHNSFAIYYALETRPYSLWLLLSTWHFLLIVETIYFGFSKAAWKLLIVGIFLCMTASVGLFQFLIGTLILTKSNPSHRAALLTMSAIMVALSLFYMVQAPSGNYDPGDLHNYWLSVSEVIWKTFHHHNSMALWLTFPFFVIIAPLAAHYQKRSRVIWIHTFGWCSLALSFVFFLLCLLKGFFVVSRQYIYLIPVLNWFYFFGMWWVLTQLSKKCALHFPKLQPKPLALTLATLLLVLDGSKRVWLYGKEIQAGLEKFQTRHAFELHENCRGDIPFQEKRIEEFNDGCRSVRTVPMSFP